MYLTRLLYYFPNLNQVDFAVMECLGNSLRITTIWGDQPRFVACLVLQLPEGCRDTVDGRNPAPPEIDKTL